MTLPHDFGVRAVTIAVLVAISSAYAAAAEEPPVDQELANAKARSLLGQANVLEAALKNAGLNPPVREKVNPVLTDLIETLVAVLEKDLRFGPGQSLPNLQARARLQCLAFLKLKKDDPTLSPDDESFANFQAAKVFLASQLAPSATSRAGTAATPAIASPAAASTPEATGQSILDEKARAAIAKDLEKQDARLTALSRTNNGRIEDEKTRLARLTQYVQGPPGPGSFLDFLSKTVGTPIASWSALSLPDQGEILAQIQPLVAGTPPTPPTTPPAAPAASTKPDLVTTIVEDAANAAGSLFVPGYTAFEPLVDDLIEVGVPAIERWRPLQRCFAGRSAAGTGRYVIPYGGTSRTRYVIVEP